MKKAAFPLLSRAGLPLGKLARLSIIDWSKTMTIEFSIITSTDSYVKQLAANDEAPKKQTRILRDSLEATAVKPELRALGRHIAKCQRKRQPVRIPAMRGSELGQVLRTLELKRAYA